MAIEYNFKYMPLVGKLSGKSMAEQTETAINEIAKIVNDNTAQAEIINTLAEEANANSVEALEKANEALETSSRVYVKETGAVDLDSYCESQLIYINNIFSQNLPVESKGFLEVKTNDDKTQATQVFIDDLNKEIYTRSGAITETQVGDVTTYTASYGAWNKSASTNYVENMVLIRQNSTEYAVGDIARSISLASYMLLECTSAGTTGASEPSYEGADVGDVITDGSVSWTIIEYASTDYVDDSIADLKNVYLPANYLPLSGGTMTGTIFGNGAFVKNTTDANYLRFISGTDIGKGALIFLGGKDCTGFEGIFQIQAHDGANSRTLIGKPDGTLTWNNSNILTASNYNSYALPLSGGTITGDVFAPTPANGDNSTKLATTAFVNTKAGNYLPLSGGTLTGAINTANNTWNKLGDDSSFGDHNVGGKMCVKTQNSTATGLAFFNSADTNVGQVEVNNAFNFNKTIQQSGKNVEVINAKSTYYVRYESGIQICWGNTANANCGVRQGYNTTVTFPAAFVNTNYSLTLTSNYAGGGWENNATLTASKTKTNIDLYMHNDSGATYTFSFAWIAVGYWK